jgi:ubiquinone/menaquinone biosynthesis C-methylase UbiE
MGVASHLGIKLPEYDARIRTFIPDYEEMLGVAAAAIPARTRRIMDLGVGTGALSARCVQSAPRAQIVGVDMDPAILALAARRLGDRATFIAGSFLRTPFPPADAVVASFALHHVRTRAAKAALYRRVHAALRREGLFLTVDCQPAGDPAVRRAQRDAWLAHLRRAYSASKAAALLDAWSREDVYVPLDAEVALMQRSGFRVEVLWRRGAFAVLRGAAGRAQQLNT